MFCKRYNLPPAKPMRLCLYCLPFVVLFAVTAACRDTTADSRPSAQVQGDSMRVVDDTTDIATDYIHYFEQYRRLTQDAMRRGPADDDAIIESSDDPQQILDAALRIIQNGSTADRYLLQQGMQEKAFLARLDPMIDEYGSYAQLRLGALLGRMADDRANYATFLVGLIDDSTFQAHVMRMQLLIYTLAELPEPKAETLAYWQRLVQPQSPLAYDVIAALIRNQSNRALDVLQSCLTSTDYAEEIKVTWLRQLLLPRRYALPLLQMSDKLLQDPALSPTLNQSLIAVLVDYRPAEWFSTESVVAPQSLASASDASRRLLRKMVDRAWKMNGLEPTNKEAIRHLRRSL